MAPQAFTAHPLSTHSSRAALRLMCTRGLGQVCNMWKSIVIEESTNPRGTFSQFSLESQYHVEGLSHAGRAEGVSTQGL